jgi:HEAT repeat protein
LGSRIDGLSGAIATLAASPDAADRAAAVWCRAALDPAGARELLNTKDPVVLRAVGGLAYQPELAPLAAQRLAQETDPTTRTALASALADLGAAERVPTRVLTELVDAAGAAAPIAAFALAARDGSELRPKLSALLTGGDATTRAHTALGLGHSKSPDSLGLLEQSYRTEADPNVRHAIVIALSRRPEKIRRRCLTDAAELDPSGSVRQAARAALTGARLSPLPKGAGSFWLELRRATDQAAQGQGVAVVTATGLSLPAVAPPDGILAWIALPAGPVTVRVATPEDSGHAASR